MHSTRDKEVVRSEVGTALAEFDAAFYQPSLVRRQVLLRQFSAGQLGLEQLPRDVLTVLLQNADKVAMSAELTMREIAFYLQAGSHSTAMRRYTLFTT